MPGDSRMSQEQFPSVIGLGQLLLVGNQIVNTAMTEFAEVQSLGPHHFQSKSADEPGQAMDPAGNQVVKRQSSPSAAEFAAPGSGIDRLGGPSPHGVFPVFVR